MTKTVTVVIVMVVVMVSARDWFDEEHAGWGAQILSPITDVLSTSTTTPPATRLVSHEDAILLEHLHGAAHRLEDLVDVLVRLAHVLDVCHRLGQLILLHRVRVLL